jgi:hypothetical protein
MEYNQQQAEGGGAAYTPVQEEYRQKCVTAMVLSIVGAAVFFLPVINIAGLILSIIGFKKSRENRAFAASNSLSENSTNTAAYVCGLVGIILESASILLLVLGLVLLGFITTTVVTAAVPPAASVIAGLIPIL